MKKITIITLLTITTQFALAGTESMPSMPTIKSKIYTVKNGEDLDSQKGFGDEEAMTRMMNLMMVEGSGYEGMDMEAMKLADNNLHNSHSMEGMNMATTGSKKSDGYVVDVEKKDVKVGTNSVEFSVKENGKVAKGLKIKSQVYMTSMDMGTEEPQVKEIMAGKYQVKASFIMKGPWAIKLIFPNGKENVLNFEVNSK